MVFMILDAFLSIVIEEINKEILACRIALESRRITYAITTGQYELVTDYMG